MLVRMLTGLSGTAFALVPGDEHDFPEAEAIRLIEAGFAAPAAPSKTERAIDGRTPERRGRPKKNVVHAHGNS